jgi:hypothetical protein
MTEINNQGFTSISDLQSIFKDQIDKMVKHMGTWRTVPTVAGAPPVNFPFLVVQKLKALHYWSLLRKRQGLTLLEIDVAEFTAVVCNITMQQLQEETKIRTALRDQVATKPEKLADLAHWPKFWEQLKTYLYQCRRAAHIPLIYLVRGHEAVTPAHHAKMALYSLVDRYMVATMVLSCALSLTDLAGHLSRDLTELRTVAEPY